ncbi:hypothetical protein M0R72_06555 [Candidatus Pacearchaeota archaeon]|jgi:hypothetical protein|nr:hypothetical protein [Candidatus Pacearchaeota archaeon]
MLNDKDLRAVAEFAGIDLDTIKLPQYVNDTRSDMKLKLQTDSGMAAILRTLLAKPSVMPTGSLDRIRELITLPDGVEWAPGPEYVRKQIQSIIDEG